MRTIRRIILMLFESIIIFILFTTIAENIVMNVKLNSFLDNQILDESLSTETIKYYHKNNKSFKKRIDYLAAPSFCDILVTTDSSVEIPLIYNILSNTVGGHAGLVGISYNDEYYSILTTDTIDTTLNDRANCATIYSVFNWDDHYVFPSYYILRVELSDEEAIEVFNEAVSILGEPYNATFLLNTDTTSYCSDLVAKAFSKVNINLNWDFGATTVIDLIVSRHTKIVGYKEYKNKVSYFYTY